MAANELNVVLELKDLEEVKYAFSMLKSRVELLEAILHETAELVSWHCDYDADENDQSPQDAVAHVNGVIWQKIQKVLGEKQ